jgi:glycine betaine/proline transport system substrate-binding protein
MRLSTKLALGAGMLAMLASMPTTALMAAEPGEGIAVKPARATWDTGWFQTAVYTKLLEELGYDVQDVTTLDNPIFYQSVAQGDVDFWVNGWFPLHNAYEDAYGAGAELVGYVAKGGALQGYLIDRKTHEEHGVDNLGDLKDPDTAALFDADGDGLADLVACPPGWGCELVIEHQMDAYGLRDTVNAIKASYSASMADAMARYQQGEPILFYTWTPNWTVGMLKPGEDVVWIEVPFPSLPEAQKQFEDQTTVEGVVGCVDDPCEMGWPANDIRPVVNSAFLAENPAAAMLFEVASIPLADIFAQNAKMFQGEDSEEDILRHADEWIAAHRDQVDAWLEEARGAAM